MATRPLSVSLEKAESYFANRLRAQAWNDASNDDKQRALTMAGGVISGAFSFYPSAYEIDVDTGALTWDDRVIAAVCEEAFWLLSFNPDEVPTSLFLGIASASAGGASVTFDRSFIIPWVCPLAQTLIGELGARIDDDGASVKTTLLAM